jgi:uncharacterized membrane protein
MSPVWRWLTGGLGLLLIVALTGGDHGSSLWPFAGRFHPLLVHFPLGVLSVAIVADGVGRWTTNDTVRQWTPLLMLVGVWSSIIAALAGLVLADWGSYDPNALLWHRRLGLLIPTLATISFWLRSRVEDGRTASRVPYAISAIALFATLLVGGHFGGSLSRGDGYLTRHLPEPVRRIAAMPGEKELTRISVANPETTPVYDSLIQPILAVRCGSCHNPERMKGGLILTNAEGLFAGGRQGKVVVARRADDSELIIRLLLPPGHTDAMPPDRPMPGAEIAMIRWWIEQGASKDVTLAAIERPASIRRTLAAYGLDDLPEGIFALPVVAADTVALRAARASGLTVLQLGTTVGYLSVDASSTPADWSGHSLDVLRPLVANVATIDVARTAISDSAMRLFGAMPQLTRLRLAQTRVTDAGLEFLKPLQYLAYLNLVDTDITDQGLRALESLPRLRAIYLRGTKVTAGGVERLQRALPRAVITLDAPPLIESAPRAKTMKPTVPSTATP